MTKYIEFADVELTPEARAIATRTGWVVYGIHEGSRVYYRLSPPHGEYEVWKKMMEWSAREWKDPSVALEEAKKEFHA